jgi:hypothetical protein
MKKYFLSALITLTSLFALAGGARAEPGYVVVHIQQDFVAGGKALPAGTYRVYQDLPGTGQALVLLGDAAGASAILIPTMHVASSPERLRVKLTRVANVYYLSEVATELGVYTLAAPKI